MSGPAIPYPVILRAVVGSTAHGLSVDGVDDRDEMAVLVEPRERVVGLRPFDQYIYRTAWERVGGGQSTNPQPPSQAGDLDLVAYGLRKFVKLAAGGNPTILLLLYAEPIEATPLGHLLRHAAPIFVSRRAGNAFLGYLRAQRQRLTGERGQRGVNRPKNAAGYDGKYAMHMLRLGIQGAELLETGRIRLPMAGRFRDLLLGVRAGEVSLDEVIALAREYEERIEENLLLTGLPREPSPAAVDELLLTIYEEAWS